MSMRAYLCVIGDNKLALTTGRSLCDQSGPQFYCLRGHDKDAPKVGHAHIHIHTYIDT